MKICTEAGITVDLFPLWFRDDLAFIWPHTFGELNREEIFPLGQLTICGQKVAAPKDPLRMLELNYGKGWRSSDPDFSFPWQEAREKFRTVLKVHASNLPATAPSKGFWNVFRSRSR